MAMIEINYKCDKCGEKFTLYVDDIYAHDCPWCPECGSVMREVSRTQGEPEEIEQDNDQRDRRY